MPTDATITVKILPENASGVFPVGSAIPMTLTTRSRYLRPYPPGNYRKTLGGLSGQDLTLAWNSRNRLTQTAGAALVRQDAADITAEVGTTYEIDVVVGGVVIRTIGSGTAQTIVIPMVDRQADNSDPATNTVYRAYTVRDSLRSFYAASLSLPGVAYSGGSAPVGIGTYDFNYVDPPDFTLGGSRFGTFAITGNGTIHDPGAIIDNNSTTFCDLLATHDIAIPGASVAGAGVGAMNGIVNPGRTATLTIDYEIIQNDLDHSDLAGDPAWFLALRWRTGIPAHHIFAQGSAGAGVLSRRTATFVLDANQDLRIIQFQVVAIAYQAATVGAVKVRIYAAQVIVT